MMLPTGWTHQTLPIVRQVTVLQVGETIHRKLSLNIGKQVAPILPGHPIPDSFLSPAQAINKRSPVNMHLRKHQTPEGVQWGWC